MTTFHGGPADGKALLLRLSPAFLRVVISGVGKLDALDRPNDQPSINETIYAYRRCEDGACGRIHCRPGGYFSIAEYDYVEQQPEQDVMRSARGWAHWCQAQEEVQRD